MSPMDEPSIQRGTLAVYNTLDELARAGADAFVRAAAAARSRGDGDPPDRVFRVALSGGSTPK